MADAFAWSNNFSVGIKSIDEQHQRLFTIAGRLQDAMKTGQSRNVMGNVLRELIAYTLNHFAFEERLYTTHAYPKLAEHQSQHRGLAKQVGDFESRFAKGEVAISVELISFLRDWLVQHIDHTDREGARYLQSRGVS